MIILGGLRTSFYKEIRLLKIAGIFQLLKSHVTSITKLPPPPPHDKIHWRQTEATTTLFWYWIYWYLLRLRKIT